MEEPHNQMAIHVSVSAHLAILVLLVKLSPTHVRTTHALMEEFVQVMDAVVTLANAQVVIPEQIVRTTIHA